jgi:acetyl esterase/lipase
MSDTPGLAGVTCHRDIEYAEIPGFRPLELDLYLPALAGFGPVPVVIHVHGGGWRRGSRRHTLPALGEDFYAGLAARGIAVAAIDYRLSGEARYPAAVDDVRAAVAWARASLHSYGPVGSVSLGAGVAAGPVALWGDSAGGHLALLAALTGTDVDGVVAWFPVTDLAGLDGDDPQSREALFLGAAPAQVPDLAWEASPITHVHPDAPPVLLMHGDSDVMVPADQSIRFAKALNDAGGSAALELVPGASHFWDGAADVPGIVARSAGFVQSLSPRHA